MSPSKGINDKFLIKDNIAITIHNAINTSIGMLVVKKVSE
jgi:hypothetical protein